MNKRQLIHAAARKCDLTTAQTTQALDAILETIAEALASGGCVTLADLGRFEVREYAGRRLQRFDGRGEYEVESRPVPVFRSSAVLRRRVRGEPDAE